MVLIIDGNSEKGAHVRSNLSYLICLRHLNRPRAVTNRIFSLRKDIFSFMRAQLVLSYHLLKKPWSALFIFWKVFLHIFFWFALGFWRDEDHEESRDEADGGEHEVAEWCTRCVLLYTEWVRCKGIISVLY